MQYERLSSSSSHGSNGQGDVKAAVRSPTASISSFSIKDEADESTIEDEFFGRKRSRSSLQVSNENICVATARRISSLWSSLTFSWMRPLLELGSKRPLENSDLGRLDLHDQARSIYELFKMSWENSGRSFDEKSSENESKNRSLVWTLIEAYGFPFILAGFLKLFHDSCLFLGPVLLNRIILFLKDPSLPLSTGLFYVFLLFLSQMLMAFCLRQYFWWCFRVGMRLRSSMITAVFNKSLVLSSAALARRSTGEITNLMSVDSTRLQDLTPYLHAIWYSFYQISLALFLLWRQVNYASLAGLCVIIAGIPFTRYVSSILKSIQKQLSKVRDERVKLCNEVFGGMKIIKLQAWEREFQRKIEAAREKELQLLRRYMLTQSCASALYSAIPLVVSIVTFTAYILLGNKTLDISTALTSLALFDLLRFPLYMLPNVINNLIEARISIDRVTSLLLEPECEPVPQSLQLFHQNHEQMDHKSLMVHMHHATFVWEGAAARKVRKPKKMPTTSKILSFEWLSRPFLRSYDACQAIIHSSSRISSESHRNRLGNSYNPMHSREMALNAIISSNDVTFETVDKSDEEFYKDIVIAHQNDCEEIISSLTKQIQQLQRSDNESASQTTSQDLAVDSPANDHVLTLSRIDLHGYSGQIIAIIGPVGSGKSSLLSGFLGEIKCFFGGVAIDGQVAYVGQRPFIQNATLKENILFGKEYQEEKYQRVLRHCCLEQDLKVLPAGDATEIGEKGINISGGQKSRVAIARAVYSDADVYLFDDPLSAVDAHVGQNLFEGCILSLRERGACVVLVTNALQYLKCVDQVIVLKDGRVVDQGSYQELLAINNVLTGNTSPVPDTSHQYRPQTSVFAELMRSYFDSMVESVSMASSHPGSSKDLVEVDISSQTALSIEQNISPKGTKKKEADITLSSQSKGKLMTDEDREVGNVTMQVYRSWLNAAGGMVILVGLVCFVCMSESTSVLGGWWLSQFSSSYSSKWFHLGIYALINAILVLIVFSTEIFLRTRSIVASRRLFQNMLQSVLYSPMSFFDSTPIGRISNRFVKDIYTIDEQLPQTIRSYISTLGKVVSVLLYISVILPVFVLVLLFVIVFYIFAQRYYIKTSRELTRLDSISRSPIYALFSESLEGLTTIRAFRMEANCWLGVRLDLVGSFIILGAALLAVIGRQAILGSSGIQGQDETAPYIHRLELLSSLAGLAISLSLNCTQSLNWSVRMSSDLESQMVSVERIKTYSAIEQEPPHFPSETDNMNRIDRWPSKGAIDFINVEMRYRPGLPLVLKGLNLSIKGSEKIGIVGRTGAGKSSLLVCLMRLVEISSGLITIDGMDIASLPLHILRSKIAVIPQDPVLFSGTLRFNLDPFNQHSDQLLRDGLNRCHLQDLISNESKSKKKAKSQSSDNISRIAIESSDSPSDVNDLDMKIEENGSNLSVGQRQLICIARALLTRAKIIVMDEATAAIDVTTDNSIQKTIRQEFSHCTCLTIAHRLNTIMDSDRVLVMDNGIAAEFNSPSKLLEDPNSMFSRLVANWETSNT